MENPAGLDPLGGKLCTEEMYLVEEVVRRGLGWYVELASEQLRAPWFSFPQGFFCCCCGRYVAPSGLGCMRLSNVDSL